MTELEKLKAKLKENRFPVNPGKLEPEYRYQAGWNDCEDFVGLIIAKIEKGEL